MFTIDKGISIIFGLALCRGLENSTIIFGFLTTGLEFPSRGIHWLKVVQRASSPAYS